MPHRDHVILLKNCSFELVHWNWMYWIVEKNRSVQCCIAWKIHFERFVTSQITDQSYLAHCHVFSRVVVGRVAHRTWKLGLKRLKPRQTVKESVDFEYDRIGTLYSLFSPDRAHVLSLCRCMVTGGRLSSYQRAKRPLVPWYRDTATHTDLWEMEAAWRLLSGGGRKDVPHLHLPNLEIAHSLQPCW